MGRGKTVEIEGKSFPTQGAFKLYVKELLESLPFDEAIQDPEHSFLVQLLKRHPNAADKIGVGIDYFKVMTNAHYGGKTKSFHVFRLDGTYADFSYHNCLSDLSPWEQFRDALRAAVMDQMTALREQVFGQSQEILCPVKKIMITRNVSHYDHVPPDTFDMLIEEFMDEEWIQKENPPATDQGNWVIGRRLVDKEMEERWRYFHASRAKIRIISKEAHIEAAVI